MASFNTPKGHLILKLAKERGITSREEIKVSIPLRAI